MRTERRGKNMATKQKPKTNKAEVVARQQADVFTEEELNLYQHYTELITHSAMTAQHAQMTFAGAFLAIADKGLFNIDGYANILEYAQTVHGYEGSKGQLSDMMNTFKAFGDPETCMVKPEYARYSFSQLKLMRKLALEDLEKVTPATTTRQLAEIIKGYKTIPEKPESEEPTDSTEETTETKENVSRETNVHVEDSGNVEPYAEYTYSISEFTDMDAGFIKDMILHCFKNGKNIRLNFKYD